MKTRQSANVARLTYLLESRSVLNKSDGGYHRNGSGDGKSDGKINSWTLFCGKKNREKKRKRKMTILVSKNRIDINCV